jgi:hypothetical protein
MGSVGRFLSVRKRLCLSVYFTEFLHMLSIVYFDRMQCIVFSVDVDKRQFASRISMS